MSTARTPARARLELRLTPAKKTPSVGLPRSVRKLSRPIPPPRASPVTDPAVALRDGAGVVDVADATAGQPSSTPRVAIIGAGIGGASAAHFLKNATDDVHITVFEQSNLPGGRLKEFQSNAGVMELGGAMFIPSNQYVVQFMDLLGLEREPTWVSNTFGVWDGSKFKFTYDGSLLAKLRALLRYLASPFLTDYALAQTKAGFNAIYSAQAAGIAFSSAHDLWGSLGLLRYGGSTLEQFLSSAFSFFGIPLINQAYITEVNAALTNAIYNQPPNTITGIAGMVALASNSEPAFMVRGGTSQIPRGLLKAAGAEMRVDTKVVKVQKYQPSGGEEPDAASKWEVFLEDDESPMLFDLVFIAAPLSQSAIELPAKDVDDDAVPKQEYQQVYTTYVSGAPNSKYFGGLPSSAVPELVGVTEGHTAPFDTLITVPNTVHGRARLFKVNSRTRFVGEALARVFEPGAEVLAEQRWMAYPHYTVPQKFAEVDLSGEGGLYYLNAIEGGASCMEISAIGARNAVMLALEHLNLTAAVV